MSFGASSAVALPKLTAGQKIGLPASSQPGLIVAIRTSSQAGFDRLVFQFRSHRPGYRVRYVTQVRGDASGLPVPLKGSSFLAISFSPSRSLAPAAISTPGYPILRQLAPAGDFEQVVSFGAGLSKQRPFRVFTLRAPQRIVIDIAH